jgi:hypothetical protein
MGMKCKLVKVSRIKFQQTPCKALEDSEKSALIFLCKLGLLWINMDENWNLPTIISPISNFKKI